MTHIRTLVSLPDSKTIQQRLTVGKRYEIRRSFGVNGVVVLQDDGQGEIALLASRFQEKL